MTTPAANTNDAAPAIEHPPGYRMRRGRNWFFLGLTYASYYLCRYNLSPIAPELMKDLNISKSDYGIIGSGRDGAYAVGQMINGLLTDRLGGKQAMTIGAIGTILLNLLFGFCSWGTLGKATLIALILIRSMDGFIQAFGAPGFIKINTAWFRRSERGRFAGIFGAMINLGAIGASQLAKLLTLGFTIPLLAIAIPKLNWHYMFFFPPIAVGVVIVLMNLAVKNTPEEAGYVVSHDEDTQSSSGGKVRLLDVWAKISAQPTVWIVAGAYFCTGFVRRAIESWWAVYLEDVWGLDKASHAFDAFAWGLPLTATLGSMASGYVSDLLFKGRRAPVAAILYAAQTVFCLIALAVPHGAGGSSAIAVSLIIAVSMMCNSTHSLLGTAAAMDLGGPRMAGCSSGIIDSFQYYGAIFSGFGLGWLFEKLAGPAIGAATSGPAHVPLSATVWFTSMLPFGLLGTGLMTYLWLKHRGTNAVGT